MPKATVKKPEVKVIAFKTAKAFNAWLVKNHAKSDGFWMKLYKKGSGITSITYAEALDEALCYGWIDGQKKSLDAEAWIQKFTPRRARSIWSKRNTEHIARLIEEKRMQPAGLAEVDAAKADGRWDNAYSSPKDMKVPDDFMTALKKNKKAEAFFKTLSKSNLYSIAWKIETAKKQETREKRIKLFIAALAKGEKISLF